MTGVPIDDDAIEEAAKARHETMRQLNGGVLTWDLASKETKRRAVIAQRFALCTYLEAVEAAVEERERKRSRLRRLETHRRLITPWKPLTDTEEPLRPAAGSMIEDRPRRDTTEEER